MFRYSILFLFITFILICSCKHTAKESPVPVKPDNYPPAISKIITTRCATAGCHNAASYQISGGGLLLDTWEHLFDGGNSGAAIVPFSPECSPLLYFTNSFEDLGPVPDGNMKMPLNSSPLTREEYLTLRNWVIQGAPDKSGQIAFSGNADTRQKIYVAHQGCDYVTVIDAEKNVIMRCVPVGKEVTIESAYSLKVAPSGLAYISFWASQYILAMDTRTDSITDAINIGYPNSNILFTPPTGNELLMTNLFSNSLLRLNTGSKQVAASYGSNSFVSPHGIAANNSFDTFFVTEQYGNIVHKVAETGWTKKISINGQPPSTSPGGPNPYNLIMSPDKSRYFVSCAGTNEVRVLDAYSDTLIAVIPVGLTPQEIAVSRTKPYLFVSCVDEPSSLPVFKGAVYIINYDTYEVVATITDRYYMPHALAVDDTHQKLFVFSRNIDPQGPVPHHNSATCNGRNGYYSVYDFQNMQPANNKRYEVTIDPFAADARFK
ncbi:MAG: hypothetical protein EOP49_11005 [Sphingobacteriales bacterium]|nr:MAG: hypothetical protein EOP49_11005 [Sphingobacteriales bacterium]